MATRRIGTRVEIPLAWTLAFARRCAAEDVVAGLSAAALCIVRGGTRRCGCVGVPGNRRARRVCRGGGSKATR